MTVFHDQDASGGVGQNCVVIAPTPVSRDSISLTT
jgi:hypothetical protein